MKGVNFMGSKSEFIFGNEMPPGVRKKALRSKKKYIEKFGDDSSTDYPLFIRKNKVLGDIIGIEDIRIGKGRSDFDRENGIIVGNIRMGFGHYRISMAMASAAHSMGYTPYWLDLNSYPETTGTKVISYQNDLYSKGSRLSKNALFNKLKWEPLNYEGFRKLSYNACDQENSSLMTAVFRNIPKDIPFIGTHVWPSQAALHAGMRYVVNAIPDNWPMALHLAEGAVHTVQTKNAYWGYRTLNGMDKDRILNPMPSDSLVYTGHYIDHELVSNIENDCAMRMRRRASSEPVRFLLSIGGAGAQEDIFQAIIKYLLPFIRDEKAVLYVNVGDYRNVWDDLVSKIDGLKELSEEHFNDFSESAEFASYALDNKVRGVHSFCHSDIFEAVYITNLLMRSADVLVTKPSELAFYPVPKLFIKRVGKHEMWGAIHSAEMGDGTIECRDIPHILQMIKLLMEDKTLIKMMCDDIISNNSTGLYDGAYKVINTAMKLRGNVIGEKK